MAAGKLANLQYKHIGERKFGESLSGYVSENIFRKHLATLSIEFAKTTKVMALTYTFSLSSMVCGNHEYIVDQNVALKSKSA